MTITCLVVVPVPAEDLMNPDRLPPRAMWSVRSWEDQAGAANNELLIIRVAEGTLVPEWAKWWEYGLSQVETPYAVLLEWSAVLPHGWLQQWEEEERPTADLDDWTPGSQYQVVAV